MFSNASQMTSSGYGENHSIGGTFGTAATAMEFNKAMMGTQMEFNAQEAQKQRDWMEYMSNTSYQRAVQDMVKAGINPILAAQNGGASTGAGGQAAAGLATGMPEQYNESSGYQMNSANSISNFGLQLEALGSALSQIVDATVGGGLMAFGNKIDVQDILNSTKSAAKTAMDHFNKGLNQYAYGTNKYGK